jgi:hypothetical protein
MIIGAADDRQLSAQPGVDELESALPAERV